MFMLLVYLSCQCGIQGCASAAGSARVHGTAVVGQDKPQQPLHLLNVPSTAYDSATAHMRGSQRASVADSTLTLSVPLP